MTIPQNLPRRGLNRRQQRVERKREQWRRQMDKQPGVAIPYPQQSRLSRNTRQSYQSRIGTWFGTAPQIIRTVEELEALDPLTVVYTTDRDAPMCASDLLDDIDYDPYYADDLPAVVVATGAQVRAAQKALEEA